MKAFTFAQNEDDLTDNSRMPTGGKIHFRSPSSSQNRLVLKFPNPNRNKTKATTTRTLLQNTSSNYFSVT